MSTARHNKCTEIRIGHSIRNLNLVEIHYNLLKEFKKFFIDETSIAKYEAYKVWSSWIITNRSLTDQIDTFLPSVNISNDLQVVQHLTEKGCPEADVFYSEIIYRCHALIDRFYNESCTSDTTTESTGSTTSNDTNSSGDSDNSDNHDSTNHEEDLSNEDEGCKRGRRLCPHCIECSRRSENLKKKLRKIIRWRNKQKEQNSANEAGTDTHDTSLSSAVADPMPPVINSNPEVAEVTIYPVTNCDTDWGHPIEATYHDYIVKYNSIRHRLSNNLYIKLKSMYMNGRSEVLFKENLLVLLNHYNLLDGLSFQWAIPQRVYQILDSELSVKGELFASPLNCLSNRYWSLFDIDRLFGSHGNFFKSKWEDFIPITNCDRTKPLVYQVNPPFIEALFIRSSEKIISFMDKASELDIPIMFIYFMPNWLDSNGYRNLKESKYFVDECIIQGNKHYYYESNYSKYVKVHFDTHILVLSSHINIAKCSWNADLKKRIKSGFQ